MVHGAYESPGVYADFLAQFFSLALWSCTNLPDCGWSSIEETFLPIFFILFFFFYEIKQHSKHEVRKPSLLCLEGHWCSELGAISLGAEASLPPLGKASPRVLAEGAVNSKVIPVLSTGVLRCGL